MCPGIVTIDDMIEHNYFDRMSLTKKTKDMTEGKYEVT